ncbi:hypothetical protein AZA_58254 [Nitrospirillum viridazoti Y2]|nr:hypothetical protein AZA_58254 [Nitrospirillum amazonense Y2]
MAALGQGQHHLVQAPDGRGGLDRLGRPAQPVRLRDLHVGGGDGDAQGETAQRGRLIGDGGARRARQLGIVLQQAQQAGRHAVPPHGIAGDKDQHQEQDEGQGADTHGKFRKAAAGHGRRGDEATPGWAWQARRRRAGLQS